MQAYLSKLTNHFQRQIYEIIEGFIRDFNKDLVSTF